MALPLAPIAITAVRIGALAAVTYYVSKRSRGLPTVKEENAHEDVGEGVSWVRSKNPDSVQANADARIVRTLRLGPGGPGIEIDATALGRIKFKRVGKE